MSTVPSYPAGTFSWIDLMTPSADTSQKYYSELFGWSVLENPTDQDGVYSMFQQGGLDVCGMGEMGEEMKKSGMPAISLPCSLVIFSEMVRVAVAVPSLTCTVKLSSPVWPGVGV